MSRTIALTGATGFIGRNLALRLLPSGWHIRGLLRPSSQGSSQAEIAIQWIEGDLGDPDSLRRLVSGVDAILHCAGAVRGASQAHFNRVNVDGVARLVQAAREQHQLPRFLLISSLAAREPHLSPYAASKRQGEEALAAGAGDMAWTAFRPPAVYGPGDKELLPLFRWIGRGIAPILGRRDARFSLLYVEDLAEAVLKWLNFRSDEGQCFELDDGRPGGYTWGEVIETVARFYGKTPFQLRVPESVLQLLARLNLTTAPLLGYAPMLTPGKVRELRHHNWVCDNDDFSRATGWSPKFSLEEGLRRTLIKKH
ncbi:MAG: NAD-dependent epimerase/dehydratase family protein [Deltaproteobacteria bacterium]|jgi:nucleoside-diphosphate-sugar epimerase